MPKLLITLLVLAAPVVAARREPAPLAAPEPEKGTPELTADTWKPKNSPVPAIAISTAPEKADPPPPVQTPKAAAVPPAKQPPAAAVPAQTAKAEKSKKAPAPDVGSVPAPNRSTAPVETKSGRVLLVYTNQMTGTIASIDQDARTLRLSVEGGFNPQFDFNPKTVRVESKGQTLPFADLKVGDKVTIHYVGKDMVASVIDKL